MRLPELANGQAQLRPLGYGTRSTAVWNAVRAFHLVQQIGEFGPRPLEARRVDVGDVVGDDFNIELLCAHAGRRN
jgi:hypothetical protein